MLESLQRLLRLPAERRARARRTADLEAAKDALSMSGRITPAERALVAAVSLAVHPGDTMYEAGRGFHYLGVGLSALRCIDRARGAAAAPGTVLDFASGYGRVLRFLRVRFPDATMTAAEIDPEAVRFCTQAFGVQCLESLDSFDDLSLSDRYDLIWCGSLLTHLPASAAASLLGCFARHLARGGMCVASVHGEVTLQALRSGTDAYGLPDSAIQEILAGFDTNGYGYADYGGMRGYGISIASRTKMTEMAGSASLEIANVQPRGWDDHHDVYGFRMIG